MPNTYLHTPDAKGNATPIEPPPASAAAFEREHDQVIADLGAFLLFQGLICGHDRDDPSMARRVRDWIREWRRARSVLRTYPEETINGLEMAIDSFSATELLVLAEDLAEQHVLRAERGHRDPRPIR